MQAAWKVTGEPKEEVRKVVEADRLDYELFDRWLKFLAKPPKFYPNLKSWQEMVKRGGTKGEAAKLAAEFQSQILEVMFDRKELNDENDVIKAKALPGTKKKEEAKLPSDFVTNDDFCPNCGLELKSMPIEQQNLWVDLFQRDLADGFDPGQAPESVKPGLFVFRGWGLERQLSAERRAYINALKDDIDKLRKEQPPKYPYVHGVGDVEKPQTLKVSLRGSPYNLGDDAPPHFLSILNPADPPRFTKGSGRLELADAILEQPITSRVIVNRIWKGHFGTGLVDTPSNFGITGERPTNPELLEFLTQSFIDGGRSIKKLHRSIMLTRGLPTEQRPRQDSVRKRLRQPALLARQSSSDDGGAGPRLAAGGYRLARHQNGWTVGAADANLGPPDRLRKSQPLQARRLPAVVRFSKPESLRGETLHHQRAAAAIVLHEQRFHAAAGGAAGEKDHQRTGQSGENSEGLSVDLRQAGER